MPMAAAEYPKLACPFALRAGTDDEVVWHCVMEANEYRLPERLEPHDVVIDIGAHVGVFCHAALARGAGRVVGYEAEPGNYQRALANLAPWGDRVALHERAVWRSDQPADVVHFDASRDPNATGGGNVFFSNSGPAVRAVALDAIVRELTRPGERRIRFLKIDVETAEFPILLTARTLRWVDEIVGEFHEAGGPHDPHTIPEWARVPGYERFTIEALSAHLRAWGFAVWSVRFPGTHLGLFFATRLGFKRWMRWRLEDAWRWVTRRPLR